MEGLLCFKHGFKFDSENGLPESKLLPLHWNRVLKPLPAPKTVIFLGTIAYSDIIQAKFDPYGHTNLGRKIK